MNYEKNIQVERKEACETKLLTPFKELSEKENLNWIVAGRHSKDEGFFGRKHDHGYDFVVINKEDNSFNGDVKSLESYFSYGKKVLSPGEGEIICIVDDIEGSEIFVGTDEEFMKQQNYDRPGGNIVVVDHGNGEYSYVAHLKKGCMKKSEGDRVEQGEELGQVGNSGNSTEPHIHYHMFRVGENYSIESIVDALKKPYPHFNLSDRTKEEFDKLIVEIQKFAKKNNIKEKTPIEEWPKGMSDFFTPALLGMIGINTDFLNTDNKKLKKGDEVVFKNI